MRTLALLWALLILVAFTASTATASPQPLPFGYAWSDTAAISVDDDWSAVPGIVGYRGDGLVEDEGVDPRTVLDDGAGTPVDVIANRTNPAAVFPGGVAEFELDDPVVALRGSVTADAPHLVVGITTIGLEEIRVSYLLRDLEATDRGAVQPFALQYRVGGSGAYADLAQAFVPDATGGPTAGSATTAIETVLPPAAEDEPVVELRILTTNAAGADEWVGVDDLRVEGVVKEPADTTAPVLGVTVPSRQSLARALRAGVHARVTLDEPAVLHLSVRISRWLAARLRLPRIVGTTTLEVRPGTSPARVRFVPEARRKLTGRERVRLTLVAVATDGAGNRSRTRVVVELER